MMRTLGFDNRISNINFVSSSYLETICSEKPNGSKADTNSNNEGVSTANDIYCSNQLSHFPLLSANLENFNNDEIHESKMDVIEITSTEPIYVDLSGTSIEYLDSSVNIENNIEMCSIKDSSMSKDASQFDISTYSDSVLEEYHVLRNKIKAPRKPTKCAKIISTNLDENVRISINKNPCRYTSVDANIEFTTEEVTFLLRNKENQKIFLKLIEDLIRKKFDVYNNVCPINYCGHKFKETKHILILYAKCTYFKNGCGKYKFIINFSKPPFTVKTYATSTEIVHTNVSKPHQLRGIRRNLAKQEIRHMHATNWRDKKLNLRSKHLNKLGNNQCVLSKDASRRLKFEQLRSLDRDSDSYFDVCKMYMDKDKDWRSVIRRISLPQEMYLMSDSHIKILHKRNNLLLKMSRNTLFFDATGSIIKKYENESKRVFLYSLVAHISPEKKKRGILLPVAEAFLTSHYSNSIARFLLDLETFCIEKGIRWPICKRICTDWSAVLINAVMKAINCCTLEEYISKCYHLCQKK